MNKKVLTSIIVLIVIVGVFAYLNAGNVEDRALSQKEAVIFLNYQGEEVAEIDFDSIQELEEHQFQETLRSSDSPDQENTYTGVLLKDILAKYDIPEDDFSQVVTKAADGYTVALGQDEVLEDDNIYVVYMINGEYLAPKSEGGSGPYQIVIRNDQFGQRWNKFLMELNVN